MKRYLYAVARSDQEDHWGPSRCVVELTPSLCGKILRRHRLLLRLMEADAGLYEMYYWNAEKGWFGGMGAEVQPEDVLADHEWERDVEEQGWLVGSHRDAYRALTDAWARTECEQLVVRGEDVKWTAIPKHASFYVETEVIPVGVFAAELVRRKRLEKNTTFKGLMEGVTAGEKASLGALHDWLEEKGVCA